jgi:hypothetical protein
MRALDMADIEKTRLLNQGSDAAFFEHSWSWIPNKPEIVFLMVFILLTVGCSIPQGEIESLPAAGSEVQLPDVAFDQPATGETLPLSGVPIVFHAYHASGVSAVELMINGQPAADLAQPEPWQQLVVVQHHWTPPAAGSYTLQARAQSAAGDWSTPVELNMQISGPPSETPPPMPSASPQPSATATPTRTLVRTSTATMTLTPGPTSPPPVGQVFLLHPSYTTRLIFKGADGCGPHMTEIHITATHPDGLSYILLFYRLISERGFDTPWRFHKMKVQEDALYRSVINAQDIIDYERGFIEYQFVAEDVHGEIHRSRKYNNIDMAYCE